MAQGKMFRMFIVTIFGVIFQTLAKYKTVIHNRSTWMCIRHRFFLFLFFSHRSGRPHNERFTLHMTIIDKSSFLGENWVHQCRCRCQWIHSFVFHLVWIGAVFIQLKNGKRAKQCRRLTSLRDYGLSIGLAECIKRSSYIWSPQFSRMHLMRDRALAPNRLCLHLPGESIRLFGETRHSGDNLTISYLPGFCGEWDSVRSAQYVYLEASMWLSIQNHRTFPLFVNTD